MILLEKNRNNAVYAQGLLLKNNLRLTTGKGCK